MEKVIATGSQDFEYLRKNNGFYVDKTAFIRKWWKGLDSVFENRGDLFEGLKVSEDADLRAQQGKWPVIFLSFAGIKGRTYSG